MALPFDRVRLGETFFDRCSCSSGKSVKSLSSLSGTNSTCLPLLVRLDFDCPDDAELRLLRIEESREDVDSTEAIEEVEASADIVRERRRVAGGENVNRDMAADIGDD